MRYVLPVLAALAIGPVSPAMAQNIDRTRPITPNIDPRPMPDAMFGSNVRLEPRVQQAAMGVKWMRNDGLDSDETARQRGYSQLYIIGFWNAGQSVNGDIFGAPRPEFLAADIQQKIDELKRHPDVKVVEFYNEHWWMFSGATMATFREDLKKTYQAIKAYNPDITVLASNTPSSTMDDIAVDGGEQYCDGFAPHNYIGCSDPGYYAAPFWRYIDWDRQLMDQYHKAHHWITEVGQQNLPESAGPNGIYMAYKLVQCHAVYPFEAVEKVCAHMTDDGWSSPAFRSAYAILATLLSDKKPAAEAWPASMLTWGEIFEGHGRSVAIVWSWAGKDVLDGAAGSMGVDNADDVAAYDIFGKPVGAFDAATHRLSFDVGNPPVYLVSTQKAAELARGLQSAHVSLSQPVKAMIEPIAGVVGPGTPLVVRLYNGGTQTYSGTVTASVPDWTLEAGVPFSIAAGKFAAVSIPVRAAKANNANIYAATATVRVQGVAEALSVQQPVQAAYMASLTPTIDGSLAEWKTTVPVTIATYPKGTDYTRLAYNPTLRQDASGNALKNSVLKIYTAYDKNNLYIAYSLSGNVSGGEWLEVALGLSDWSPRNVRVESDPWAYKGYFVDSDYIFAIDNPRGQVWRLAAPDAEFRTPYNWIIATHGGGPEKNLRFVSDLDYENDHFYDLAHGRGAKLAAGSDGGGRVVECSIPRSEIPEFKPESGRPIRMSFMLRSKPEVEGGEAFEWGKVAGEFPFMKGHASFVPSWQLYYDNQLPWGVR